MCASSAECVALLCTWSPPLFVKMVCYLLFAIGWAGYFFFWVFARCVFDRQRASRRCGVRELGSQVFDRLAITVIDSRLRAIHGLFRFDGSLIHCGVMFLSRLLANYFVVWSSS